jgi:hypothetical protein
MANRILRSTGTEEDEDFVREIVRTLIGLDNLLFHEVVYHAEDPRDGGSFGSSKENLIDLGILQQDGSMSERVRDVIRSATEVVDECVKRVMPFAD